jgi:RND family efflux transporter MFP subunit
MHDYLTTPKSHRHGKLRLLGLCALLAALLIAGFGIFSRHNSDVMLTHWTQDQAVPSVAVISPQLGVGSQELVLPGEVEANYQAPIYARVSGYVKMWYQDIGAHVKAGQLLAEIDTPDLDQQLMQAKADLSAAEANATLADLTAKRWKALLVSNSVSQQTTDEKVGNAAAMKAQAAAANANVQRLNALEAFKRIVAPFDGIVTARKTDIGALITAGGGTGPELFSVADLHQMRIYVRVPQALSAVLKPGMTTELKLPQYPDAPFTAKLATTSNAVNPDSRTVLAEFIEDNADGKLWPGTFAEAHLQLPASPTVLHLPTSALLFREHGLEVALVGADDKVILQPITVGRDLGTQVEVTSGITEQDRVIDDPSDSIATGDVVKVEGKSAIPGAPAAAPEPKNRPEDKE